MHTLHHYKRHTHAVPLYKLCQLGAKDAVVGVLKREGEGRETRGEKEEGEERNTKKEAAIRRKKKK